MQKVRVKLISSFNGVLLLPILLKLAVQAIVFVFNSRKISTMQGKSYTDFPISDKQSLNTPKYLGGFGSKTKWYQKYDFPNFKELLELLCFLVKRIWTWCCD